MGSEQKKKILMLIAGIFTPSCRVGYCCPECASRNFGTDILYTSKVHSLPEDLWPSLAYRIERKEGRKKKERRKQTKTRKEEI
jgi:hypothetical protein